MNTKKLSVRGLVIFFLTLSGSIIFSQNQMSIKSLISDMEKKLDSKDKNVLYEESQLKEKAKKETQVILEILDSHKDSRIRRLVLRALENSEYRDLEEKLLTRWDKWSEKKSDDLISAARLLGYIGSDKTLSRCKSDLQTDDPFFRTAAFHTLFWMKTVNLSKEIQKNAAEILDSARMRGENIKDPAVCLLSDSDLVSKCRSLPKGVQTREYIHEIGDRAYLGILDLKSREEKKILQDLIDENINDLGAAKRELQSEANENIQRLWHLCVPQLIETLGAGNDFASDFARKDLMMMRNREIVKQIIEEAQKTDNIRRKQWMILALGGMKDQLFCLIRDRDMIDDAESEKIAQELILPFLNSEKGRDSRPEIQSAIEAAFNNLATPRNELPRPLSMAPMKMW
jgi:hypothetical protein